MSPPHADGFFTLGIAAESYNLPHPRIPLPIILIVRRVLLYAFAVLRQRGFALHTAQEDEITIALLGIVENDLRQHEQVPGFNRWVFEHVTRQRQVENYDFVKAKKAPDLCFTLRSYEDPVTVVRTHDALFVECKPVDASHAAGSAYCDDGLQRFVDGDYAWAMQDAMMLGYARQGRSLSTHLLPAMQESARNVKLKTAEFPHPVVDQDAIAECNCDALHISRHHRGFAWPDGKGPACDILIYHSWHRCD